MKYEDFIKALQADQDLAQKFQAKLDAVKPADEQDAWQIAGDAARELGFDVDASEFALAQRSAQPLSDNELDAVTGGGNKKACMFDYICYFGWNSCAASNECDYWDMCSKNIASSGNRWIWTCKVSEKT